MTQAVVKVEAQQVTTSAEIFGDETINAFLAKCRSANTLKTYRNAIRQLQKFFAAEQIATPTEDNVNLYFAKLAAENKSATTRRLYLTVVKKFFAFTANRGIYPNVAADVTERFEKATTHAKKALSTAQAQKLCKAVEGDSLMARRDRAIVALALQTGVRTIEIERANVKDFTPNDDAEGYLLAVTGKGHKTADATVRVAQPVADLILSYLNLRGIDIEDAAVADEPLFASTSRNNSKYGNRFSAQSVQKLIRRSMVAIGIKDKKITPHSCRHFAATTAIKAGTDIREVAAMLRHTSINITAVYLHDLSVNTRRAEMAVADTLFGGVA